MAHHLAGLARRHLHARVVDQADVVALGRAAHGVQLVGVGVGLQDAGATAFGHAVELHQAARPARQHVGLQRGVERGAGAELHAKAAEVVRVEIGPRHQAAVLHRHQHGVGHPLGLRERQPAGGVELGHQQHRAAIGQRGKEHHQRGVGVQRGGEQRHRVRPVAVDGAARHVHPAHAVRLHDALGRARGARRVDDVEGPAGFDRHQLGGSAGRSQPVGQRTADGAAVERDARHRAQAGIVHRIGRRGIGEQHPRARVLQHARKGVGRAAGCQRRHHHPGPQRTEVDRGVVDGGGRADGDRIAGAQTVALQRGGHPVHAIVERGVVDGVDPGARGLRQRGAIRGRARVLADQVGNGTESGRRGGGGEGGGGGHGGRKGWWGVRIIGSEAP